ncbi:hypothetical protein JCM10213_008958 [Rhodosporidiobolus nylandii]
MDDKFAPQPGSLSTMVAPSAVAAFRAHCDAMPGDSYMSTRVEGDELVVSTFNGDSHALLDEQRFPASANAANIEAQMVEQDRKQAEWMLGKSRAEIEAVWGWPAGLSEDEMQQQVRETLGLDK